MRDMLTVFRKEIKYLLPVENFYRLESRLDGLMHRDSHGDRGTYSIRSLYFDSLTDRDLWDNLDGVMEKRKIRIRVYSPEDLRAKLEYKCKSGSDGVKYSLDISRQEALGMERGEYAFLLDRPEPLAARLYVKMTQGAYLPKTVVAYDRTAFLYPVSDVRVTFDHNLRASAGGYGLFDRDLPLIPLGQPDVGVLEVKYNDFLPSPIKKIVNEVDSLAEASSKYSKSRFINA